MWALRATHFTGYNVLLLVYVGPRAAHFTGYCCWLMWDLNWVLLVYVAPRATLYWVLMFVYMGIVVGYVVPRETHLTCYCCWFMRGLGQHTDISSTHVNNSVY
jgi:hypothetical protein